MRKDLLINSSGLVLNILEKILDANIEIKGEENIPLDNPKIFVANHFTRMEAMLVPYAMYDITGKKVGVIADDSLFKTYFGSFLEEIGAMPKSAPCRNNIMLGDLITGCKDWMIFPEGSMIKAKDISKEGNHYCVKVDGVCQRVFTGASFFALNSQLIREDYFNNKIKNIQKFQRKHFIRECKDINELETMIVPINITYSHLRTGKNFLVDMASKFLQDLGDNYKEELEIEGNIVLNSKITIQILKPISTKQILADIYEKEQNHNTIINKYRYELTHRFMKKIYESLTVNFDHIFALIIFLYPKKNIDKNHFKRLIYLVINEIKNHCLLYDSDLDKNLINLVSYERYEPFEDILSIAIRDGIIQDNDKTFRIRKSNLLNSFTSHTIRLKNILRVILNEILVIDSVKEIVQTCISKDESEINNDLLNLLQKDEVFEFEDDYRKFKDAPSLKPKHIGEPYFKENKDSDICIINIHGFSAAPMEMIDVSDYLYEQGYSVYAPRLKGHGTAPEDLKDTTWQEWYLSLSRAISIATLKYKKVYIIGFSTGGLLALLSSKKCYIEFAGIVCINAALHLNDIRLKALPAVSFWNDLVNAFNANDYAKEYVDNLAENPDINYDKFYITAIEQLHALMNKTKKNIPKIQSPILIIQSKNDPVVNPSSAYEIYDKIKSKRKNILLLNLDNHVIVKGKNTKELFKEINKFLLKT